MMFVYLHTVCLPCIYDKFLFSFYVSSRGMLYVVLVVFAALRLISVPSPVGD